MNDPQSSTSASLQPTLPTLPDPQVLWSQPQSSKYLLQEARANIASLNDLKTHIQSGRINYGLEPPKESSLIELPPIPIPNYSTHPTSFPDREKRPMEKPDLPSTWKGKGKECLSLFREEWGKREEVGSGWLAEEEYGEKAIRISSPSTQLGTGKEKEKGKGGEGMTVWATLSGDEIRKVDSVKVFVGKSSSTSDLMSTGWHIGLSNHLTELSLTMAELLYRVPHLPQLLHTTCFYCGKYLKVPDGLPVQHTGYLAGPPRSVPAEADKTGDSGSLQGEGGKWVCWHDSCGHSDQQ